MLELRPRNLAGKMLQRGGGRALPRRIEQLLVGVAAGVEADAAEDSDGRMSIAHLCFKEGLKCRMAIFFSMLRDRDCDCDCCCVIPLRTISIVN